MLNFYHRHISPFYHSLGSALFGSSFACRFHPTCSVYAQEAYRRYGIITGTKLSLNRFFRCHPFSPGGLDPVPDNQTVKIK